ncbi:MAG: hypothetical protein GC184_03715 [Rhizobiales bacterium]|nr:hypothetical protein [Hyphomicrobiales bacterium]
MFQRILTFFGLSDAPAGDDEEELESAFVIERNVESQLDRIRRAHAQGKTAAVGQVMILNLDAARERIGEKWPLVSRHVHMLVDNLLSRRLGRESVYFQCEEGLYAIVFADRTKEEAEAHCRSLSVEIMERLFGNVPDSEAANEGGAEISIHGAATDLDLMNLPSGTALTDSLKKMVIAKAAEVRNSDVLPSSLEKVVERSEEKLARLIPEARRTKSRVLLERMKTLVQQLRELENGLSQRQRPIVTAERGASHASSIDPKWRSDSQGGEAAWTPIMKEADPLTRLMMMLEKAEEEIASLEAELPQPDEAGALPSEVPAFSAPDHPTVKVEDLVWQSLPDQEIQYTTDYCPFVDLETGVKGIYLARMRFLLRGRVYDPETLVKEEGESEVRFIADRLLLRSVAEEAFAAEGVRALVMLPVDQSTLDNITSMRSYLQLASQFSEARRRQVVFEVTLAAGWQAPKVSLWLSQLQPYCRAVFVRFPLDNLPTANEVSMLGAWSVRQTSVMGVALPYGATLSAASQASLQSFRRLSDTLKLRSYVLGLNRPQDVAFCQRLGVRYVTSEALFPAEKLPNLLERLDIENLIPAG